MALSILSKCSAEQTQHTHQMAVWYFSKPRTMVSEIYFQAYLFKMSIVSTLLDHSTTFPPYLLWIKYDIFSNVWPTLQAPKRKRQVESVTWFVKPFSLQIPRSDVTFNLVQSRTSFLVIIGSIFHKNKFTQHCQTVSKSFLSILTTINVFYTLSWHHYYKSCLHHISGQCLVDKNHFCNFPLKSKVMLLITCINN